MTDNEKAYGAAVKILAVSDNTALSLFRKLTKKGFSRESAAYAVNRLVSEGLLDERRLLEKTVASLYEKLYGPAYIKDALGRKMFSSESKKLACAIIDGLDFDKTARLYREKAEKDGKDEAKIYSELARRGFITD